MRRVLACLAFLVGTSASAQQPDQGCQVANALLGALLNTRNALPCKPSSPAGANTDPYSAGAPVQRRDYRAMNNELDTPENLAKLLDRLNVRYASLNPEKSHAIAYDEFCMDEMRAYSRFRDVLNSGYDQLQKKCIEQGEPIRQAFIARSRLAQKSAMEANDRERAAQEKASTKKEADELSGVIAELRSGKRIPTNCAQYMITKGESIDTLKAEVMVAAYQAPKGLGPFLGAVDQINDDTLVLSGKLPGLMQLVVRPPDNSILQIGKDTRVFNGAAIRMGGVVEGYATQISTRTVKLVNGRSSTIAVMRAHCVAGSS